MYICGQACGVITATQHLVTDFHMLIKIIHLMDEYVWYTTQCFRHELYMAIDYHPIAYIDNHCCYTHLNLIMTDTLYNIISTILELSPNPEPTLLFNTCIFPHSTIITLLYFHTNTINPNTYASPSTLTRCQIHTEHWSTLKVSVTFKWKPE